MKIEGALHAIHQIGVVKSEKLDIIDQAIIPCIDSGVGSILFRRKAFGFP
jgi:hypothetical protein